MLYTMTDIYSRDWYIYLGPYKKTVKQFFSYQSVLTYVLGAKKNHLSEMVLLSTHNIHFGQEI